MKKIIASLLVGMIFIIAGCGSQTINTQTDTTEHITTEKVTTEEVTAEAVITKKTHENCMLTDVASTGDNTFDCSYEGVKHNFILDLPESNENAPLVVMLHGYGNSAEEFRLTTGLEQDANAMGYAVVYVTGAPSPEDATSAAGWNSGVGVSSNNDVDFLCGLVNYLCETYGFDKTRVFAVGFSNGAFMTHRLAIEADDIFAAVVSVAGMMSETMWNEKPDVVSIGVFQITGEKDDVVPKNSDGSAQFSKAPAIEEVMDYYIEKDGLTLSETVDIGKKSTLDKYTAADSSKQVWNLFIPDGRHSWPDEQIVGFNTNQLILEFLETQ